MTSGRRVGHLRDQTGNLLSMEEEGELWIFFFLLLSSGVFRTPGRAALD